MPKRNVSTQAATNSRTIGWIALILVVLAGSTFASFGKQLLGSLSPLSMVFIGEFSIWFFILFSFGTISLVQELRKVKRKDLPPLLLMGGIATCSIVLLFTGLEQTKAANAEIFTRSEMLFLLILGAVCLREKITHTHMLAMSIIVIGIVTVALRGLTEGLVAHEGDFLILAGAFGFGVSNTFFKKYLTHLPPELVLFWRTSTSIAAFFLVSPFLSHPFITELRAFPVDLIPVLIGFGFISRFLAILSFYEAVERLPISTISLFLPLNIIGSVSFAHFYLGESILWYHFVGGGLVLLGAILMAVKGIHPSEEHAKAHLKQHHRHHL